MRVLELIAQRQRTLELSSSGNDPEWRNRLIWGDKKYVLPSLLPEFAGKVDLIYIDPPFDTGADFSFTATVADHSDASIDDSFTFTKEPSVIEQKAYRDTWGRGINSYLQWFYETSALLRELQDLARGRFFAFLRRFRESSARQHTRRMGGFSGLGIRRMHALSDFLNAGGNNGCAIFGMAKLQMHAATDVAQFEH